MRVRVCRHTCDEHIEQKIDASRTSSDDANVVVELEATGFDRGVSEAEDVEGGVVSRWGGRRVGWGA